MRPLFLLALTLLLAVPANAQLQSHRPTLRHALLHEAASADRRHTSDETDRFRFWPSVGAAALGAGIGGGLGALIGEIDIDEIERERDSKDEGAFPAFLPGIVIGSTVGAMAGAKADPRGSSTAYAVGGSLLGMLGGGLLGAAVSGSEPTGVAIGMGVGAAFGAGGAVGISPEAQNGLVARDADGWRIGLPQVRRVPDPLGPGTAPRVRLTRIRF